MKPPDVTDKKNESIHLIPFSLYAVVLLLQNVSYSLSYLISSVEAFLRFL